MKSAIWHFFNYYQGSGGIPWETYLNEMKKEDFGLALRIEEDLAIQNRGIAIMLAITLIIISIFAIRILWNQRKIKKQLQRLLEEQEKEDKPNN